MYDLSIPGYMPEQDLIYISEIASQVPKNGVIVELGSYKGRSAVAWASSCDPSVTVYCVDTFVYLDLAEPDFFEEFKANTKHLPNIVPIRGWSPSLINYPGDKIDVFFNDAAHLNPYDMNNLEYFIPFIKPGGLLCGHDCEPEWPAVMENVKKLEERFNQPAKLYENSSIYSFRL